MSTIETAVVITLVMLVLTGMIVLPARMCADTMNDAQDAIEDVMTQDELISPERLNTFLTGISENYRIIYGAFIDFSGNNPVCAHSCRDHLYCLCCRS